RIGGVGCSDASTAGSSPLNPSIGVQPRRKPGAPSLSGGITLNQGLTLGKIRGLSQLSTERGVFSILACDQRGNMIRMLQQAGTPNPTYDQIVKVKLEIVGALSPLASGALLD